ncbi:MAG: hypothetical protein F2893_01795 [Actinobacteria bacterium]|uniref:Unannotated protein n=1 Tax=freshwater metagenome TaxID=449393 RepID=A0A6J7PF23_9ZZZZ|nr:hypothetical protein [Actinomycetota bacterium]MSV39177.1 hypothetical protein [Actinomycetota bacterium]MSY48807.1 hypothetical protein [Actinomycetota bacterium]MTH91621.1 hypothetical protein [Actinomycetota bacterium]
MAQDSSKAAKARAVVASLLFIESGIIAALGVWLIVLTLTAKSFEVQPLIGDLLFVALGSGGLAASAMGYRRGKYFGRSPAVLANLIALGVVSYQIQAGLWLVAIPLAALAAVTLAAALRAIPE